MSIYMLNEGQLPPEAIEIIIGYNRCSLSTEIDCRSGSQSSSMLLHCCQLTGQQRSNDYGESGTNSYGCRQYPLQRWLNGKADWRRRYRRRWSEKKKYNGKNKKQHQLLVLRFSFISSGFLNCSPSVPSLNCLSISLYFDLHYVNALQKKVGKKFREIKKIETTTF